MNKEERIKLAGAYCKLILAGLGQPVDVSDIDAITYVKMHRFAMRVKKEDGTVVDAVTHEQMHEILKLIETPSVEAEAAEPKTIIKEVPSDGIAPHDKVIADIVEDGEPVETEVKAVRVQLKGYGNKYYDFNQIKKVEE